MGRKRRSICKRDGGAFKRRRGGGSDDEEYAFGEEEEVEESLDDSLAGDATEEEFEYGESSCGSEEEPDLGYDEEEEEEDRNEADDEEVVALDEVDAGSAMARIGRAKRSRDLVQVDAEEELDEGLVRSRRRNAAVLDYAEDEEEDDDHDEDFLPDDGEDAEVDDEDIEPFQKRRKFRASTPKLKQKLQEGGPDDYNDNDFIANNPIALNKRRNKIKNAECRKRLLVVSDSDSDSLIFEENVGEEFGKQRCGICLSEDQKRTVQGKLDCCAHFFCSACIMEWSKVETRCPVCRCRFSTITKTSKSNPMFSMNKVVRVQTLDQIYQPSEGEIRQMLDPYGNIVCTECQQAVDDHLMLLCDIIHIVSVSGGKCQKAIGIVIAAGLPLLYHLVCKIKTLSPEELLKVNPQHMDTKRQRMLRISIPIHIPNHLNPFQVNGVGGSTLSGRRTIHQRIRILLSNSRPR